MFISSLLLVSADDDSNNLTVEKLPAGWEEDNMAHPDGDGAIMTLAQIQRVRAD